MGDGAPAAGPPPLPEPEDKPPGRLIAPWATKTPEPLARLAAEPFARTTSLWPPLPLDPELPEPELDPVPVPSLPWVGIVMSVGCGRRRRE